MVNRSWSEPVRTGLVTAKNRKRPVYIGPVRFFGGLGVWRTGLGLGPRPLRLKTETGPDFQSLAKTTLNGAYELLKVLKESSDVFTPLKSVVGGVIACVDVYKVSRVETLTSISAVFLA